MEADDLENGTKHERANMAKGRPAQEELSKALSVRGDTQPNEIQY